MLKKVEKKSPEENMYLLMKAYRELDLSLKAREQEFKESIEEDKMTLEILKQDILDEFRKRKTTSEKFGGEDVPVHLRGTLYISPLTQASVDDPEKFFGFILVSEETDLLTNKVSKKAVEEYIELHKEPPPGIVVSTKQVLKFRKEQ